MTLLSLFAPAFACGGFAPKEGALATSDAQQALFDLGEDSITVTYRAFYTGDAADFAWVIAVPGQVQGVVEGDADRLTDITLVSAPQVELDDKVERSCGCGSSYGLSDKAGGDFGDTGGVEVTGTGVAGNYTYTTLAASDADSLVTWLTDHGYDVSLIQASIEDYVADPLDYEFVAVQLQPDVTNIQEMPLEPLAITYGAASDGALHALFPAKLGVTSTVSEVRTEIFVLGQGKAELSGWEGVANPDEEDGHTWDAVGPDYWDPAGVYTVFLREMGGTQRKMWLAYSGEYDGKWLTRYDAIVAPATNTVDPVFTDSDDHTDANTIVFMMNEADYERQFPGESGVVLVGLLAGAAYRRKRR